MIITDPIANSLTHIRNANMVKHESSEVLASKVKRDIVEILKREGFVCNVEYIEDGKQGVIRVFLKSGKNGERIITSLKHIPEPGLRAYVKVDGVPKVLNGLGITTISTSKGVVTDKEAREKNIGDEAIAYVW